MHRCAESAGRHTVEFQFLTRPDGDPLKDEYICSVDLHEPVYAEVAGERRMIEDIPRLSNKKSWTGELCAHEIDWLHKLPGTSFNLSYRFTVKETK